jgi:transcriptional regulator
MFVRHCWEPRADEEMYSLIEANPWALLVNNGDQGPFATNLPLLLDRSGSGKGVLVGHLARANAHADSIQSLRAPALALFQGPYSYITSSWYPNRDMPPTYYYSAVHCYGVLHIQDEKEMHRWIEILTERMESQFPNGWKTSEIEESAITRRLKAIIGFEMHIDRLEGKFKLGQDEPKKDALAVASHLAARGGEDDALLARHISERNSLRRD